MPKGHKKGEYKTSEETKRKIGLALKGHFVSQKIRDRMANLNKGKFGKNHPCYKENKKHLFHKLIRETFKYRQWRSDIFERDNYTCQVCGIKSGNGKTIWIEAHHPKSFIEIINKYKIRTLDEALNCEELYNINNGITLCRKCHLKTNTWGRLKKKMQ